MASINWVRPRRCSGFRLVRTRRIALHLGKFVQQEEKLPITGARDHGKIRVIGMAGDKARIADAGFAAQPLVLEPGMDQFPLIATDPSSRTILMHSTAARGSK